MERKSRGVAVGLDENLRFVGQEAQNAREDFKMGLTTLRELYGKRGLDWMEWIDEAKYLLDQCAKKDADPGYVQLITPNDWEKYESTG